MISTIKFLSLLTVTGFVGLTSLKFAPQSNAHTLLSNQNSVVSNLDGIFENSDFQAGEFDSEQHLSINESYKIAGLTDGGGFYSTLYSYSSSSRINVRSGPGTNHGIRHYGFSGDPIYVSAHRQGPNLRSWYKVQFVNSGAEGWVREDLIAF